MPPELIVEVGDWAHLGHMKSLPLTRCAIVLGVFSAFTVSSYADSLFLYSSAAETANNSSSATMNIDKNPRWDGPLAGSSWVSNVQSGDPSQTGFVSPANGTNVIFTDTFTINGIPTDGILNVLADDTTSVSLNGVLLEAQAGSTGNTYATCSDTTIGCLAITEGDVSLRGNLQSGVNILSFDVAQVAGSSFGLDYAGTVNYTPTPEPATFALLGLPLTLVAFLKRKRQKA
jgi:hypothetical protein